MLACRNPINQRPLSPDPPLYGWQECTLSDSACTFQGGRRLDSEGLPIHLGLCGYTPGLVVTRGGGTVAGEGG